MNIKHSIMTSFFVISTCLGTLHRPEGVIYEDQMYMIYGFPLEFLWSKTHPKPCILEAKTTRAFRGYVASWEASEQLILKSMKRDVPVYYKEHDIYDYELRTTPINEILPDANEPVVAHWYSGVVSFGRGPNSNAYFISYLYGQKVGMVTRTPLDRQKTRLWTELYNHDVVGVIPDSNQLSDIEENIDDGSNVIYGPSLSEWVSYDYIKRKIWVDSDSKELLQKFIFRGICFPNGIVWIPCGRHIQLENPDSIEIPQFISPVEIEGKLQEYSVIRPLKIEANWLKVLPYGSPIEKKLN